MCPIQFFCLVLIISIKYLFSSTFFITSSFVMCSVQLILSILLHIHISKASIRLTSSFLIVHVSAPYSVTLPISSLTILFLMSLFDPHFNNSFLLVNASFPIAILFLISCGILHLVFSVYSSSISEKCFILPYFTEFPPRFRKISVSCTCFL